MDRPGFSRPELIFMLAVPLGWATLLLFHPNPTNDIHAGLHHHANQWMVVHLGTLVFIGLIGAVLRLLVRDLPGRAAHISRLAITPFVLFYGAGEAILGVTTGVLVQHANEVSDADRPAAAAAVQAIWSDVIAADLIIGLGSIAWGVAVVGAAVGHRLSGAPLGAVILLGAAAVAMIHTPPFSTFGLSCLAGGIAWLGWRQRATDAGRARSPIAVGGEHEH